MLTAPTLRLPAGMRDFAPEATAARRRIAEALTGAFERWGFARVITPAFEYEDVLALGLGTAGRAAAIRFVEPSSGQVVALPPDITPQIARLIATRFHHEPGAVRLCYEGTVVRLDPRARAQREIIQAGVELAGVPGPVGDAEVIALGVEALGAAGLGDATIALGHLGLAREVLDALGLTEEGKTAARGRIAKRDSAGLAEILRVATGPKAVVEFAQLLPELSGAPAVLDAAIKRAPTAGIRAALGNLRDVVRDLDGRGLARRLHIDLGEVRGFDYYTGVRFQGYVHGAAQAVLQGGRYDGLLARYGHPSPAVGFAIDVEATAVACEESLAAYGSSGLDGGARDAGVLVAGPLADAQRQATLLRRQGRRAAADLAGLTGKELDAYARRWHFREVLRVGKRGRRND